MPVQVLHDLRNQIGSVRDQGVRPTCLAFAVSDTHAVLRPGWEPLSCEYLYFHAVRLANGNPNSGATILAMLQALQDEGQPLETEWPYLANLPGDITTWYPPNVLGIVYRRAGQEILPSLQELVTRIEHRVPVIIGMSISNAFYLPDNDGLVRSGEPVDQARRHAIVGVGLGAIDSETFVLVRNSWGSLWGIQGYAWLSEIYLRPRLLMAAELTRDLTNVPTN